MPYQRLETTQPGVNVELTPLANRAGWSVSSLIRWRWQVPENMRGWQQLFANALAGVCRCIHWWADLSAIAHYAFGTNEKLYVSDATSALYDITPVPAQFTPGAVSSGTTPFSLLIWSLDNFGEDLVAIPSGQGVFIWIPPDSGGSYDQPAALIQQGAALTGGEVSSTDLAQWQAITDGGFDITVNGVALQLTALNFAAATGPAEIASIIQDAISGVTVTGGEASSGDGNWQFTITTNAEGSGASLSYATPPTAAGVTDISSMLGWTAALASSLATGLPAPAQNQGGFVGMPEQIIIAYGCTPVEGGTMDPLLLRWCDQSNYFVWIASTTNQAGSFRLPRGSRIVGGLQGPAIAIIWTDLDAWSMQYIGFPLVFGLFQLGSQCGLLAQNAAIAVGATIYWLSDHGPFQLTGSGAAQIPCPVWDSLFLNLDIENADKCLTGSDYHFGEVWWFFPSLSGGSGEIDSYIKFNIIEGEWDYGPATVNNPNPMARTAWTDQNRPGDPVCVDLGSLVQQQEQGYTQCDTDLPVPGMIQSGFMDMTDGAEFQQVDQFLPDLLWEGQNPSIAVTLFFRDYPGDTPTQMGPFTITPSTEYVTLRQAREITIGKTTITAWPAVRAREVSLQIQTISGWWRFGACRLRKAPSGRL